MSELRQDRASGRWTVIAPERGHRPREWSPDGGVDTAPLPPFDPVCPFCPGNEAMLSAILVERPADAAPGWQTRVVPNKFPAFSLDGWHPTAPQAIYTVAAGRGYHEVIIETPRHDLDLPSLPQPEAAALIQTYRERCANLMKQPDIQAVVLFRNYGRIAGASLRHPHSQTIALSVVPPAIEARETWAHQQHDATGNCVLCDIAAFEQNGGHRLIFESNYFLAFVPFAAASPFETWLVPKRHRASFSEIDEGESSDLVTLLQRLLLCLRHALNDPPYNYVIESATPEKVGAPFLHWYLRIVPNLIRPGGFELGSGLMINPSLPERDAETLRRVGANVEGSLA